jgi:hypothetical protein
VLRCNAFFSATHSGEVAAFFEFLDGRGQGALSLVAPLPRGIRPVNRSDWRLLRCSNGKIHLTSINIAEP